MDHFFTKVVSIHNKEVLITLVILDCVFIEKDCGRNLL